MISVERWAPIKGLESEYSVSDLGNIRTERERRRRRRPFPAGSRIAIAPGKDGYLIVSLAPVGERAQRRCYGVARLVFTAFSGPIPVGKQINHINGVKTDNRLGNLEIVTPRENVRHSIEKLGRDYRGMRSPNAKLTDAQVVAMRESAAAGSTFKALARRYNVDPVTVATIVTGKGWQHIGGPISAPRDPAARASLDFGARGVYRPLDGRPSANAKLTAVQVVAMRERAAAGETSSALMVAFGVTRPAVNCVLRGATWSDVGGPTRAAKMRGPNKRSRLST